MTEMLEGSDWNITQTIQTPANIYIYKFTKNNVPIYVAWWDYFNDPAYFPGKTVALTLSGMDGANAVVTEAVANFSSGSDVTDYATAFRRNTLPVSAGTLILDLEETPVFIEVLP